MLSADCNLEFFCTLGKYIFAINWVYLLTLVYTKPLLNSICLSNSVPILSICYMLSLTKYYLLLFDILKWLSAFYINRGYPNISLLKWFLYINIHYWH